MARALLPGIEAEVAAGARGDRGRLDPGTATTPAALEAVVAGVDRRAGAGVAPELVGALVAACDVLLAVGGAVVAFFALYEPRYADSGRALTYAGLGGFAALLLVQRLWSVGAYGYRRLLDQAAQLRLAVTSWTIAAGLLLLALFLLHVTGELSRVWFVGWYLLTLAALVLFRAALVRPLHRLAQSGWISRRAIALVGPGPLLRAVGDQLQPLMPHLKLTRHALDLPPLAGGELNARLADLRRDLRREGAAGVLMLPIAADAEVRALVFEGLRELPVDLWYCPVTEPRFARSPATSVGPMPALHIWQQPLSATEQRIKRAADIVIAGAALLLLSPLLLVVALAVKLDSPGPVFFRQPRFGFNNRCFAMLKFRTMYAEHGDPSGARRTVRNDPRVTRLGRFLRRSSIDELPQLWNVLRGDMSIVGPRAHPIEMKVGNRYYHEAVDRYFARHRVRPGITGWAQVHGLRGEVDTLEKARARVAHDLYYVENWSLLLDLKILALTVVRGFAAPNAY